MDEPIIPDPFSFICGARVRDRFSQQLGEVVARVEYRNGLRQYQVRLFASTTEPQWLDEQDLTISKEA